MNVIIANKYQTLLGSSGIDVIKTSYGVFQAEEIVNLYKNFFYNKLIIDITAVANYENIDVIQSLSLSLDMSKVIFLLDDSEVVNSAMYLSKLVSFGIYNFTKKVDTVKFLIDHPNAYKDVAAYQNLKIKTSLLGFNDKVEDSVNYGEIKRRVVGIQNVTEHAGATTLTYLMKKELEEYYSIKCIEVNKNDYLFFNDKELISANSSNVASLINEYSEEEIILVDLNGDSASYCTDVIYLIEPGIIKLNKLIKNQPSIFDSLKTQKVILNMSVLTEGDVSDFENESGIDIFTKVPYVDDKLDTNPSIISFLIDLGFTRVSEESATGLIGLY